MPASKFFRNLLWPVILFDALIVIAFVAKIARTGTDGFYAWFRHVHLVPVSTLNGEATYQLQPDYRFTAFYLAVALSAVVVTSLLLRMHFSSRNGSKPNGGGHDYDAPQMRGL